MSPTLRGALLATAALALVGSLVASADLVEGYPLPTGQALRYTLAGLVLLALARGRLPRLDRREALGLLAVSATGLVLFNLFVIEGVRETDPATVGVIIGCVPVLLALAGPLLEGRALSPRVIAAAVVVAVGAAGVQWAGGGMTAAGLAFALGALACEAGFSLLALPYLARLGPLALSTYACLFAVPLLAAWRLVANGPSLPLPDAQQAGALAYMAVGVTVLGFVSWYTAIGLLGVERAGLFSGVLPVSALACSVALGVAEVTPGRLVAVVVVAAGITLGVRARGGGPPRAVPAGFLTLSECSSTASTGSATRAFASASGGRSSTSTPTAFPRPRRPPT